MFGAQGSSPAFGNPPSSTPAFSSSPLFGAASSTPSFATPAFGTPPAPSFGTPSTPAFGAPATSFGTPSTPAFGTPSTPAFGTGFGFSTFNFSSQAQQQQQLNPLFSPQPSSSGFGIQTPSPFANTSLVATQYPNGQLTTLMAPVAPLPFSLADRDIQAIVDAYKEEPGNPKYAFKHLLFSVTDQQFRIKPPNISDIMWAEALGKLEGMDSADRERLWPQLANGFKDLSQRLKLQDDVIISDSERLKKTQSNVKLLQRHIQAATIPQIQRLKHKEQNLQRRLLRAMRILEALESKGYRLPLTKQEIELAEKLASITRQLKGSGAELSNRVQNLVTISRVNANRIGAGSPLYLPGSTTINEQSLADMLEVLQQQTVAISRLANVLKRDIRDLEIMSEDNPSLEDNNG